MQGNLETPSNWQTVQAPFFLGNPSSILVFRVPSFKSWIFYWTSKILKFFILNTIYLLKITKFFVKIPHFEFLVMTEKNIFVYKPFLTLNVQILIYFLRENCNPPPEKGHPLFPSNSPLKFEVLSSPNFWKIWLAVQRPPLPPIPLQNEGGAHYV